MDFLNSQNPQITRRLVPLLNHIQAAETTNNLLSIHHCKSKNDDEDEVAVGDVKYVIHPAKDMSLVPWGVAPPGSGLESSLDLPQEVLQHLRWMLQKEQLNQDMFLLGPPGPLRRWLAFRFCELLQREAEYVALSRDTTESDLKIRRELVNKSVHFIAQPPVVAGLEGRFLIIEGMEKCERNVLPVLNNLLENREMSLEDGRFLMNSARYDALLSNHTKEDLDKLKIVRVHPKFRVIALGLPVGRYTGNPLDPPLRSRFQGRDVQSFAAATQLELLQEQFSSTVPSNLLRKLVSVSESLKAMETTGRDLFPKQPHLSFIAIQSVAAIMQHFPDSNIGFLFPVVFPFHLVTETAERNAIIKMFSQSNVTLQFANPEGSAVYKQQDTKVEDSLSFHGHPIRTYQVNIMHVPSQRVVTVPHVIGGSEHEDESSGEQYVEMAYHNDIMVGMMQSHIVGADLCLIGGKGSGKSTIASQFGRRIGYHSKNTQVIHLFKDMTARDLIQRRVTLDNGDTTWVYSALIESAVKGYLVVLDGLHRLHPGTVAVIQRLIHDREMTLFDGTRLVRKDRYEHMINSLKMSHEELKQRKIIPVHPSFRVIALATPPTPKNDWLTSEVMTLFHFHSLPSLATTQKAFLLRSLFPKLDGPILDKLLAVDKELMDLKIRDQQAEEKLLSRNPQDIGPSTFYSVDRYSSHTKLNDAASLELSLRQLIRICRHVAAYPTELWETIHRALLSRFMPLGARERLESVLSSSGVKSSSMTQPKLEQLSLTETELVKVEKEGSRTFVTIGEVKVAVNIPENPSLVPDVVFFDIPKHIQIMKQIMKDFLQGENILLVGNQGVGKNKIVDKLLGLLQLEREYMQLNRDSSIQSLTVLPSVREGLVVWEDSPLVKAVISGRVLVVDEADKAPLEVVCILKGLVQDKQMLLSDGRRIIGSHMGAPSKKLIPIHPDFRMIVLANRPGYPFLGNDFFAECGDCFSCHTVENPDIESEIVLLKQYAPTVDPELLRHLATLFGDLRKMNEDGLLGYPYSLRELVNIVRHLNQFQRDALSTTLENVFSFDSYDSVLKQHLKGTFQKHGIMSPNIEEVQVMLAHEWGLNPPITSEIWIPTKDDFIRSSITKSPLEVKLRVPWVKGMQLELKGKTVGRAQAFTELKHSWDVESQGFPVSICSCQDNTLHVLTTDPFEIHSYDATHTYYTVTSLTSILPLFAADSRTITKKFFANSNSQPNVLGLCSLSQNRFALFIGIYNLILIFDSQEQTISAIEISSQLGESFSVFKNQLYLSRNLSAAALQDVPYMDISHSSNNLLVVHKPKSDFFIMLDLKGMLSTTVTAPFKIRHMNAVTSSVSILQDVQGNHYFGVITPSEFGVLPFARRIQPHPSTGSYNLQLLNSDYFEKCIISKDSNHQTVGSVSNQTPLSNVTPQTKITLSTYLRGEQVVSLLPKDLKLKSIQVISSHYLRLTHQILNQIMVVCHPPQTDPTIQPSTSNVFLLEVFNIKSQKVRYILYPHSQPNLGIQLPSSKRFGFEKKSNATVKEYGNNIVSITELPSSDVALLHFDGSIFVYEINPAKILKSVQQWKSVIGYTSKSEKTPLSIQYKGKKPPPVGRPKVGQVDPANQPHVGGNTFQGGTGGTGTAGIGGRAGPFRRNSGNPIVQISDEEKAQVAAHIAQEAREMAKKALEQRLAEIQMTEFEAEVYDKYLMEVAKEVSSLRVILEAVRAKQKERVWTSRQSSGEFDDRAIVESIMGEQNIYKKRSDKPPEDGTPQQKPKRIRFVMDVSGSMYRFNSTDKRLERLLLVTLMIMEAFKGYEYKYHISIVGHSGDSAEIPLVNYGKIPENRKERLKILYEMSAHSEYCPSGDRTLEGIHKAVKDVVKEEGDDYFVFVVSDANLGRYAIQPQQIRDALTQNPKVNAYIIFIGSLDTEAETYKTSLPVGKAFICMDTAKLPGIFKEIFTTSMLKDAFTSNL